MWVTGFCANRLLHEEHVLQINWIFGGGVVEMSRVLLGAVSFIGVAAVLGLVVLWAYYFGLWPEPNLVVDDPAIEAWLERDSVMVHRRGLKSDLRDTRMYIQQGQMIDGSCRWTTRLSMPPGQKTGVRVARTLAIDRTTCEKLVLEGTARD